MSIDKELATAGQDLRQTTATLFSSEMSSITLPSSLREVNITPSKVRNLGQLMKLFETTIKNIDPAILSSLITAFADRQRAAIAAGVNPTTLDNDALVVMAAKNTSIIFVLFTAAQEVVTGMVHLFTDLTPEEFLDLEMDDGVMVVAAIFAVNYDFFMQRLLPISAEFIRSRAGVRLPAATSPNGHPKRPEGSVVRRHPRKK